MFDLWFQYFGLLLFNFNSINPYHAIYVINNDTTGLHRNVLGRMLDLVVDGPFVKGLPHW